MATVKRISWATKSGTSEAWQVTMHDAAGRRLRRSFGTRREAEDFRLQNEARLRTGRASATTHRLQLADLIETYLADVADRHARGALSAASAYETRRALTKYAMPTLGRVKLAEITPRVVLEWRKSLVDEGVGLRMVEAAVGALRTCLRWGKNRDLVTTNAAADLEPLERKKRSKVIAPTPAELRKVLDACDAPDLRLMITFAAATGLRFSEMRGLRWSDLEISPDAPNRVNVKRSMDRHGNIAEGGKSDAATRSIIIGPSLAAMLLEHKRRGGVARWPTDLVFVNREGRPASYNATAERWRECCRAAGVSFNWHSLRHFAVTSWIAAGLPVKAVQVAAGHSSATMTLDVYSDYWPTEGHEAAFIALDAQLASPPAKGGRVDAQRGPM